MKLVKGLTLLSASIMLAACGSSSDDGVNYPSTYEFASKLEEGQSSVKFTGQAARQILIGEMKNATGNGEVTTDELFTIYNGGSSALKEDNIYDTDGGTGTPIYISAPEGFTLVQGNYTDVLTGAGSKKLSDKIAGCDNNLSAPQFIGWDMTGLLVGCASEDADYHDAPHSLMLTWIKASAAGNVDTDLGLNYQQLFQKFLLGSVAFSQTAEDYLNTKNLVNNDNSVAKGDDDPFTELEHSWDEGFGYFGASSDYLSIADATIKGKVNHSDVNKDGEIDLLKGEYNYGLAQYASKHDVLTGTTDLSSDIMTAFLEGRQLIQDNFGINPAQDANFNAELAAISNRAVNGLEKIFAISVVKYINETIGDLGNYTVGAADQEVDSLAKHWSELKGFALGLQFRPDATMSVEKQLEMHALIGQSPITRLNEGYVTQDYIDDLIEARTLVQIAFGLDATAVETWGAK